MFLLAAKSLIYKTYVTKMNTDISFQQQKLIEICEAIHNSIFTEFFCHT